MKNLVHWIKETRWRKEGKAGVKGTSPALVGVEYRKSMRRGMWVDSRSGKS